MARDRFRGPEYFEALVRDNEESLRKFEAVIADPATAPEHRRRLRHTTFLRRVEQLIARYSRGESTSALRRAFPDVVSALKLYHAEPSHSPYDFADVDDYVLALWLVSLGILLEVEASVFVDLVRELDNDGRDLLYERLVASRVAGRGVATQLLHPTQYANLARALDAEREERLRLIQSFLGSYYSGLQSTYWHDSHLGENAGFFGYWCFELAAVVKILALDDRAFSDNPLYPRDLPGCRGEI